MRFCGSTSNSIRLKYKNSKYELNHSLHPKLRLMPHQVLHPSHLLWVWLFFRWFPQTCMKIPTHIIRVCLKKDFLFWCSSSAFNKNFPQFLALICVKWFILILPRFLFTPIVLRNCFRIFYPFCMLFIFGIHFLYQCTKLKFPHLPFGYQNPSSWHVSLSQAFLYTIWLNI